MHRSLDPEELPEWLQRSAEEAEQEMRHRVFLARLPVMIAAVLIAAAIGALAWMAY